MLVGVRQVSVVEFGYYVEGELLEVLKFEGSFGVGMAYEIFVNGLQGLVVVLYHSFELFHKRNYALLSFLALVFLFLFGNMSLSLTAIWLESFVRMIRLIVGCSSALSVEVDV